VKEGSCPRCLSEEEPEPPAADMARSALRLTVAGEQKEKLDQSHDTRVYCFANHHAKILGKSYYSAAISKYNP